MAATTYFGTGITAATYGVPVTYTGMVIQSYGIASKAGVFVTVLNEKGQQVIRYYDDIITEVTVDMVVSNGTIPTVGAPITFTGNATVFEVQTVDVKYDNKAFPVVTVKAMASANIIS